MGGGSASCRPVCAGFGSLLQKFLFWVMDVVGIKRRGHLSVILEVRNPVGVQNGDGGGCTSDEAAGGLPPALTFPPLPEDAGVKGVGGKSEAHLGSMLTKGMLV
jgi:hypothetical protein